MVPCLLRYEENNPISVIHYTWCIFGGWMDPTQYILSYDPGKYLVTLCVLGQIHVYEISCFMCLVDWYLASEFRGTLHLVFKNWIWVSVFVIFGSQSWHMGTTWLIEASIHQFFHMVFHHIWCPFLKSQLHLHCSFNSLFSFNSWCSSISGIITPHSLEI